MATAIARPNPEAQFPAGTTLGEMNAWIKSLYERPAVTKAAPVAPRRAPRPIEGQTFAPEAEARSVKLTVDEARYLDRGEHFGRRQVLDLMRADNRVGVCG